MTVLCRLVSLQSTIVSEGFKGGTRGSPIMPRDVSLSDSKCWNGGHEWVEEKIQSKVEFCDRRPTIFEILHLWDFLSSVSKDILIHSLKK